MMKCRVSAFLIVMGALFVWGSPALAEDALYQDVYVRYPRSEYIVGIGETMDTGSAFRDRRVSEIMARRELAAQIRVEVSEVAIDIACSGGAKDVVGAGDECRDEFASVLETRVDEFLEGSRIVEHGEHEGRIYAVAVMEKQGAAREFHDEADKAADQAKKEVDRAKKGEEGARERAKEEYLRARALSAQGDALSGTRGRADDLFEELEQEILKLGEQ